MSIGSRPARARAAGFTLLEVMIAMAILLVGLLGMMRFQMVGISSNNAGRMQTLATGIALELVSGIERLPFGDPLISPTGTSGPTPPSPFGRLLTDGSTVATGAHAWDDAAPIPGVRLSTEVPSAFERRWSVWGFSPSPGALPAVKIVAVSVVWTEPALRYPRELVLYTQLLDAPALVANLPANQ